MSKIRMLAEFLKQDIEEYKSEKLEEKNIKPFLNKLVGTSDKYAVAKAPENKALKGHQEDVYGKPQKSKKREKWTSAGCVVFPSTKDMSKVYVIQQKNWNTWSFPKGRVDPGETLKKTAIREVREETGLSVALLPSGFLGKAEGGYSITHFFAAVKTGGSAGKHDDEVSQVKLVPYHEAFKLFQRSGGKAGGRDLGILRKAWMYADKYKKGKVPEWKDK